MKIGFWENIPVLQNKVEKCLAHSPYKEKFLLEAAKSDEEYDLVLCDKNYFSKKAPKSEIYLVSGSAKIISQGEKGILLTGGMNREDSVSFSSIGEDAALICIEREIFLKGKSIVPFETKVPFDRNFSLYKNIASGFAQALITQFFTEEP